MSYGAPSICPDDATFQYLAKAYSYNHRDMTNSSTCRTFRDGITNGAEWYVALGKSLLVYSITATLFTCHCLLSGK